MSPDTYARQEHAAGLLRIARAQPLSVEERAAQLVDAWLRGYMSQPGKPALGLEELADIAAAARQAAISEREERKA